ncbi:MAG: hypothetical protein COX57_07875 [Alphaproteobacteria bacterium CG_4_10_14_0_2_um_filter_63_37]|nr:MAG: hypothetical protein AUJ55_03830 [Proteobacteria bacterium CG1_02_64_396]PJA24537.1 MAG: hypothetical protein COX57_07875 [Alphaproteobacteria bacterium CG_4_10_14_0_2_um_filter_63_37]
MTTVVSLALALAVSLWTSWYLARPDAHWQILDHPNERSLHDRPTPRSGGLGVLAGCAVGWGGLAIWGQWPIGLVGAAVGVVLLAVVSLLDDIRGLSPLSRFAVHGVAAALLLGGGIGEVWEARWGVATLSAQIALGFGVVWVINLYNFMDGMDGFAGGMGVFGFGSLGVLGMLGDAPGFAGVCWVVAAGNAGFLVLNFPPAKIFMGDVGSTPMGYCAAALSLLGIAEGLFPWWAPLLVFAPFWVDATVTLMRRLMQGEKVWRPHRSHYYQRWVQLGWGHRRTVLAEYGLMALGTISAVAATAWLSSIFALWALLLGWCGVYAVIAYLTHRQELRGN